MQDAGDLDQMARERGFRDYATMTAWYRKYRRPENAGVEAGQHNNTLNRPAAPREVEQHQAIGPGALFEWIRRRFEGARQ